MKSHVLLVAFMAIAMVAATPPCAGAPAPMPNALIADIDGSAGPVVSVAFRIDGSQISFGTEQGVLRVWRLRPLEQRSSLRDSAGFVAYTPFSLPDGEGSMLVTLNPKSGCMYVWQPDTQERQSWTSNAGTIGALSFNGRYLATTFGGAEIGIWQMFKYAPEWHAIGMPKPHDFDADFRGLALNHNGSLLAACGRLTDARGTQGGFVVWDRLSGRILNVQRVGGTMEQVAFAPAGNALAIVGTDEAGQGTVSLWDEKGASRDRTLAPQESPPHAVAFSADGTLLATGAQDGVVRLWDVASGRALGRFAAHDAPLRSLAFSRDGQMLATACEDGHVRVWTTSGLLKPSQPQE